MYNRTYLRIHFSLRSLPMTTYWIFIGICPLIFQVHCSNLFHDVAEFCLNNGLTYLTISSKNLEPNEDVFKVTKEAHALNLMTRELTFENIPNYHQFYSDALIILMKKEELIANNFHRYWNVIQNAKIKRTLIVFTTLSSSDDLVDHLRKLVLYANENAMIQFMFQGIDHVTKYYQVISIKNGGVSINPLDFNNHGHMIEKYNLQVKQFLKCKVTSRTLMTYGFRVCIYLEYLFHGYHK